MSLLAAPTWLLAALLVLLVVILLGPERTYQRALTLLRAIRGTEPPQPPTPPAEADAQASNEQAS